MGVVTNVLRRRGRYWFRIRVPVDIVPRLGRRELWRALETADPAVARQRAIQAARVAIALWQRVRSDMSLSKDQIDQLVVAHFHQMLEVDEGLRIADKPALDWRGQPLINAALKMPHLQQGEDGIVEPTDEAMAALIEQTGKAELDVLSDAFAHITRICSATALSINDWADAKTVAELVLARAGLEEPYGSPAYRKLCMGLLRAMHEASRIILARSAGDYSLGPSDPLFKAPPMVQPQGRPERPRVAAGPHLSELVEKMLAEKAGITAKFKQDYRVAVSAFEQTLPSATHWTAASRREVAAFKDLLLKTPTNWTKHYQGKSLPDVARLAAKDGRPRLSSRTINDKYLALLSTTLKWAVANGYADQNPAQGVKVVGGAKSARRDKRAPFTIDQLQTIFAAPLFTGCRSDRDYRRRGKHRIRDHRFWVPLIGLFSGARLNEIGLLRRKDVQEVDGIRCFRITDEGAADRHLKTAAAERLVPIHQELLRLGLLEYVERIANATDRIFADWPKGADGYYSSVMSKWFGRFLADLGLTDRRLVFHSFRHTFIDGLRAARIEMPIRAALVGHETGYVEELYGRGYPAAVLHEAVDAIAYPKLDLSAL